MLIIIFILLQVPNDFHFSLYDLDHSVFQAHLDSAKELTPVIATTGIKSNVCGPESFTPDHKPILGEDPRLGGKIVFSHCSFQSYVLIYP